MSKFQIILLVVFGVFIVGAVATFSLYRGGSAGNVTVTVLGDIPSRDISLLLNTPALAQDQATTLNYVEKSAESLDVDFTEALARGTAPDLIIITQDSFWKEKPKLTVIPYASVSERDFKSTFIEEGEL